MLLWFAGASLVVAWVVFHDPALDHRVLVAGALLPDVLDAPLGGARIAHTVLFSATLLVAVMLATRGRRHTRRRWLVLPIGTFIHLLADGAWTRADTFWWPLLGGGLAGPLPSFDHGLAVLILQEVAGAAALVWFWRRFRLGDPAVRAAFVRTGRLPRDLPRDVAG
ncbi:MAG: hypothetical protein M3144_09240 [Actinomycetota bacterium]|nr:hypothetical protein [Actinomycetota bacterium]